MHVLKHSFLLVGIWIGIFLWDIPGSYGQESMGSSYASHQILISYKPKSPTRQNISGSAILSEHKEFVSTLRERLGVPIQHYEPVFQSFIDQLISQQFSERELLQQFRDRNQSRRGYPLSKVSPHRTIDFCRSLCLWVSPKEVIPLIQRIREQESLLEAMGYHLTSVSVNKVYKAATDPNDTWFPNQYAHRLTGAVAAWENQERSEEVVIGVVDSGVDPGHEDLIENLLPGRDFVHLPDLEEWKMIEGEDYLDVDDDPTDYNGHGTAISGIIAARNNNELGISGVCPKCKIMPLRAMAHMTSEFQGDTLSTIFGFDASFSAAILYGIEQGVDVLNFSFGSNETSEPLLVAAIDEAWKNGIVMVGGAGNLANSKWVFPAANRLVIAVASTNENDQLSDFSNYGDWIDVSAPGSNIFTTYPFASGALTVPVDIVQLEYLEEDVDSFTPDAMDFTGFTSKEGITAPVEFVGLAREEDVINQDFNWNLEGKLALIERGETFFFEKVNLVRSFGAVGAIIFNNGGNVINGTLMNPQEDPIPVVSISQIEGENILEALSLDSTLELTLKVYDIEGYAKVSGTSFASPYVAGMAGLILSQWPDFSTEEVRNLIKLSTDNIDGLNPGREGQLGSGRVNLAKLFENVFVSNQQLIQQQELAISPNPVSNKIWITQTAGDYLTRLQVINQMGQEVYLKYNPSLLSKSSIEIDISNLPPGHYIILGTSPQGQKFKRIVKVAP